MGKAVLVTGAGGFIGSHLVDALLDAGDEVTVVDHLQRGHTHNLASAQERGVRVHRADVTDVHAMLAAFEAVRPQVVYHLAAQIDVRRSVADPSTDAHVNVGGTAAVLEAARHTGTRRVVLASTAGVGATCSSVSSGREGKRFPVQASGCQAKSTTPGAASGTPA